MVQVTRRQFDVVVAESLHDNRLDCRPLLAILPTAEARHCEMGDAVFTHCLSKTDQCVAQLSAKSAYASTLVW